jgi:hypothetical protein
MKKQQVPFQLCKYAKKSNTVYFLWNDQLFNSDKNGNTSPFAGILSAGERLVKK